MEWGKKRVLITGGCSFIGSHLVDALVERGVAHLRVVDDLSTGKRDNVAAHLESGAVELVERDLFDDGVARAALSGTDVVFHLAALHGGRGYIDRHQAACSQNLLLDALILREAQRSGVEKYVYTSSACVYPPARPGAPVALTEDAVGPPYEPDGLYGWAKLSGELAVRAYHQDHGLPAVCCRLFTAYGERCLESHALLAMIGRAFLRRDPFEVWGTGEQVRSWTYVADVARGLVVAAESIGDGTAVNLGSEEPTRVLEAARAVLAITGHQARIELLRDMPQGPQSRIANSALAAERLGWRPQVTFDEGLRRTIAWYYRKSAAEAEVLARDFDRRLLER
jgi:nucleoside-diphosphate-sugar epimerase